MRRRPRPSLPPREPAEFDPERIAQMADLQLRRGARFADVVARLVEKGMPEEEAGHIVAGLRSDRRAELVRTAAGLLLGGVALAAAGALVVAGVLLDRPRKAILWAWVAIVAGGGMFLRGVDACVKLAKLARDPTAP